MCLPLIHLLNSDLLLTLQVQPILYPRLFTPSFINDPIDNFQSHPYHKSHTTPPTTTFSPTSSTTYPTQLPSSSFTNTSMKDYVTPDQPFHPATGQSSLQANTIILTCPIDDDKYNFFHYSPPTSVFVCVVNKQTTIYKPFTYNEAMNKTLSALEKK